MSDELLKQKIILEADTSGVRAAVSDAKADVESLGGAAEEQGKRAGDAFEDAGSRIEKSTAGVRKFTGAISSTVGVLTGMVGAVTGVVGVLSLLKRAQDAAAESSKRQSAATNDLVDRLQEYRDTAIKTSKESESAFRSVVDAIDAQNDVVERSRLDNLFRTAQQIKAEKDLEAQVASTQAVYEERSRVEQEARQRQVQGTKQLNELLESQRISLLPDDEQLQAQADRQKKIILETFNSLGVVIDDDLVNEALNNVDKITKRQLDAEKERQRIADDAQRARDAESAARQKAAAEQAAEAFASKFDQVFGADFTTRLDTIAAAINRNTSGLGRLK